MNVKKFKTIYLSILIPITVIICIVSTWYRAFMFTRDVIGFFKGGNAGSFFTGIGEEIGEAFGNGSFSINPTIKLGDSVEQEYDVEFKNIDIDLAVADVEIKEADSYRVVVEYPEEYMPEVKVEGDTLIIKHTNEAYKIQINGWNHIACDVTIYVPEGSELGDVNMNVNLGNIEIKDKLILGDVEIEANLGNVEIENIKAADITVQADLGNVEIKKSVIGALNITAALGDVKVKNTEFTDGIIQDDLGAIEVEGSFESLEAECSLGDLQVQCDNIDEASMDLEADLGSVKVNGKNHGSEYHR